MIFGFTFVELSYWFLFVCFTKEGGGRGRYLIELCPLVHLLTFVVLGFL